MRKEIIWSMLFLLLAVMSCNIPGCSPDTGGQSGIATVETQSTRPHVEETYVDEVPGAEITIAPTTSTETEAAVTDEPTEEMAVEPSGPCTIVSSEGLTVYTRPSTEAEVFGPLGSGMEVEATAQTADGWWGFDPGVAQAANMGVFRYRWIEDGPSLALTGGCSTLPVVAGPAPGFCFMMPMGDVPVMVEPYETAALLATMSAGDYTAVTGRTADGWIRLDLAVGNLELEGTGWMAASYLNVNGPCESIPDVVP
ncbi:MAG: hypothetical protein JXA25_08720 [Anaerolineales bacterium]|nr:hypothetical protein [Anaerolineales bacterium]